MIEVIKPKPPWHVLKGKVNPDLCSQLADQIIDLRSRLKSDPNLDPGDPRTEDSLAPNSELELTVRSEMLRQIANDPLNPFAPYTTFSIESAWGQVHETGMSTDWHTHGFNMQAAVIYLRTPENCGRLIFENPIFCLHTDPYIPKTKTIDRLTMPQPEVGDWVCFPSWVRHKVSRNMSPEVRASYAFNFFPAG